MGRHRGREGKIEVKLQELLGDKYSNFDSLNNLEKAAYVLGSELWEDDFGSLLSIIKEFLVDAYVGV